MIVVKVDTMLDNYALKNISETVKEMADRGVIVLDKSMDIVEMDEKAAAGVRVLETPEGIPPQVLR